MGESVNWSDLQQVAEKAGFTQLAPGEYEMVVDRAEATKSKASDNPMISAMLKVIPALNNGTKGNVWDRYVLGLNNTNADKRAQSIGFFFRKMKAFGLDKAYFDGNPQMDAVAAALVNRQVRAVIEHDDRGQAQVKSLKVSMQGLASVAAGGNGASASNASVQPSNGTTTVTTTTMPQAPADGPF